MHTQVKINMIPRRSPRLVEKAKKEEKMRNFKFSHSIIYGDLDDEFQEEVRYDKTKRIEADLDKKDSLYIYNVLKEVKKANGWKGGEVTVYELGSDFKEFAKLTKDGKFSVAIPHEKVLKMTREEAKEVLDDIEYYDMMHCDDAWPLWSKRTQYEKL